MSIKALCFVYGFLVSIRLSVDNLEYRIMFKGHLRKSIYSALTVLKLNSYPQGHSEMLIYFSKLDNCSCVVLPTPIHGLVRFFVSFCLVTITLNQFPEAPLTKFDFINFPLYLNQRRLSDSIKHRLIENINAYSRTNQIENPGVRL